MTLKKYLNLFCLLLIVFASAIMIWYSPTLFKNSPPALDAPILTRNIVQHQTFAISNDLDVVLSPELIKEQGQEIMKGNHLPVLIYAKIFNLIGMPSQDQLPLLSISIHALALLIFVIIVFYLFNLKIASLFAFIYILLPFNWQTVYGLGQYEIPLFFFALFFLFYFLGIKKQKIPWLYLVISGIFLSLTCISKEAFLLFAFFFIFFLFFSKRKKELLLIFIPFIIMIGIFWLPDTLKGNNIYSGVFPFSLISQPDKSKSFETNIYEFYPDPYTYKFAKEEYIQDKQAEILSQDTDFFRKLDLKIVSPNRNIPGIELSLFERIIAGISILLPHLSYFSAIEYIGGPIILFFIILGFCYLKQNKKHLYRLFLFWIGSIIFLMSFITLSTRSHLMDFGWALALPAALGIFLLINILKSYFKPSYIWKLTLAAFIILLSLYNLILANHVAWGDIYNRNQETLKTRIYSQKIKQHSIKDQEVIATPLRTKHIYSLNYKNEKSLVRFKSETIKKLIQENKLQDAFNEFNIKYILGYSDKLTSTITNQTKAQNIASSSIDIEEPKPSQTKMWFLNLIK